MRERMKVWVQDKGRGNLRLQWYDENGRRKTESAHTTNRAKAERRAATRQAELDAGGSGSNQMLSWGDFRDKFMEMHAASRRKTIQKYETVFDVFEDIVHPAKLAAISEQKIFDFVLGMRKRKNPKSPTGVGLAAWTQRNYLVALKTALAWAVKARIINRCPNFPSVKVPKKRPQPVPQIDFDKLLAHAVDDRWRLFLLLGWFEGLRLQEALELRWEKCDEHPFVDLVNQRIHLPAGFSKNGEDDWLPLHPTVAEAFAKVGPIDVEERVFGFLSRKGGGYLTADGASQRILALARRAGVKLSMHKLRKGFGCRVASQLGKGNAPILHRLMRHSSMQVTMEFYASVDDALGDVMKELK